MLVPVEMLEEFQKYVQQELGQEWRTPRKPQEDEFARFMFGERLVVVRPITPGAKGEQVEVWCGDSAIRKTLEDGWTLHMMSQVNAMESLIDADVQELSNE